MKKFIAFIGLAIKKLGSDSKGGSDGVSVDTKSTAIK